MIDETRLSRYLDDLPALYREPAKGGRPDFLGRFLLAFEHLLTGVGDPSRRGLEEILEGIAGAGGKPLLAGAHRYFDPGPDRPDDLRAPEEFLEWLSGWVALTLREDWSADERRRILAGIVPSYRLRGTPDGLRQVLSAFTGLPVETIVITEFEQPFQLGVTSTIGKDTAVGGGPAHYFLVEALVPASGAADLTRKRALLRAIIDVEKPAHTYYELQIQVPTMQIAVNSTVGVDTLLGT